MVSVLAFSISIGNAYRSNRPTYSQMQSLAAELEVERKVNAAQARQLHAAEQKLIWKEYELMQAQRQINKLNEQISGLRRRIGALQRPFVLSQQAYEDGLAEPSVSYDGFRHGTPSERSAKSQAVRKTVTTILSAAGGSRYKAAEIIHKILKHPKLVDAIEEDGTKQDRETRDAVVTELLQSLAKLKHSPKNSEKWHAYNYILHAVVPAQYKHPELLAKYIGSSWTKVISVSKNKILINEEGDWGVGHSVKTRKDAFRVQYAEYLPRIEGWWTSGVELKLRRPHM